MKYSYFYCITLIIISFISATFSANCYGPTSKLSITEFDAFPSPVAPGGTLYIRANVKPGYEIQSGRVQVAVYYTDKFDVSGLTPIINIVGLDLCTLSSKVTCPIKAGSTVFEWEFPVPNILPGTYQVRYTIIEDNPNHLDENTYSCIQFPVTVEGEKPDSYLSWYQATLLGVAVFDHESHLDRQLGNSVQVGPYGPLNATAPGFGSIKNLAGSGELVPNPYYDTSNYVWGMHGTLTSLTRGARNKIIHVYQGKWYLGYKNALQPTTSYDATNPLAEGDFNLTWSYSDNTTGQVSGFVTFEEKATIPVGWGFPLVYGRIARHDIITSDSGFLMIKGSDAYCVSGTCKTSSPSTSGKGRGVSGLSGSKLGLVIGLPIAVIFALILVAALFLWMKRRRESEAEDGVFAVARKPEYGSALVVDDIIQETRGSKMLQSMIDIKEEYSDSDDDEDDDASATSRSRSRSRSLTPSHTYSPSASRSRSRGLR